MLTPTQTHSAMEPKVEPWSQVGHSDSLCIEHSRHVWAPWSPDRELLDLLQSSFLKSWISTQEIWLRMEIISAGSLEVGATGGWSSILCHICPTHDWISRLVNTASLLYQLAFLNATMIESVGHAKPGTVQIQTHKIMNYNKSEIKRSLLQIPKG